MTKIQNEMLLQLLSSKENDFFKLEEEELTSVCHCAHGQAIFKDKTKDKYYRFSYRQFDEDGEYYLGTKDFGEVEEVKRIVEVSETLKNGKIVALRETVHFEEIEEDDESENHS
jgi:hypothetical protein